MSRPAQLITDLSVGINVWKIAVRVIDLWIVKERNGNQHIEAIIQDVKHVVSIPTHDASYMGKDVVSSQELLIPKPLPATSNQTNTASPSAAQNWSPEKSLSNTPSKRLSGEDSNDETEAIGFLSPKQSATKSSRPKSARHSKAK